MEENRTLNNEEPIVEEQQDTAREPEAGYSPTDYFSPEAEVPAEAVTEEPVESFIPSELFQEEEPVRRRMGTGTIIAIVAGVLILAIVGGLFGYYQRLKNNPSSYFQPSTTVSPIVEAELPDATAAPTLEPEATAEPEDGTEGSDDGEEVILTDAELLAAQADTSMMQNIVNICLIGVDYAEERETGYGGKAKDNAFHADVIMILAINFDENTVDMISIPRDTYAKIPGVKGIYKINASLDCGGGLFAKDGAGFDKVCETASWMLGGIPVDYYYAVTMTAVKQLGDAVGGVDFDVDIDFKIQGRSYKKGMQHLDGQGILDYFRVRKNIKQSGDNNRVNRQKKLLLAIFNKMKNENMLVKIPEILNAFDGMMYTNTSMSQTAALALFGMSLDSENVKMHSMGSGSNGTSGVTNIFNWNFCLTDQANRVKIIKNVYGVDVPQYAEYTSKYAHYRWYSMLSDTYLDTAEELAAYVKKQIAADDLLPTPGPEATAEPQATATPTVKPEATKTPEAESQKTPIPEPTQAPTPKPEPTPQPEAPAEAENAGTFSQSGFTAVRLSANASSTLRKEYQKYSKEDRDAYNDFLKAIKRLKEAMEDADKQAEKYKKGSKNHLGTANEELKDAMDSVKSKAISLAKIYGYSTSKLDWDYRYEYVRSFNEIAVNFN